MAISEIIYDGETLIDLTGDSVTPGTLLDGETAHAANGERIVGRAVIPTKVSQLENDSKYITETQIAQLLKAYFPYSIRFDQGKLFAPATSASYSATSVSENSVTFQYRGGSGVEELAFPITGLFTGRTYTISFDETYNGGFIQDTYRYGCGIIQKSVYDSTNFPTQNAKPAYIAWHTGSTGTQKGSFSFTAESDTVYWVWSLGRLSDGVNVTITFNARVF